MDSAEPIKPSFSAAPIGSLTNRNQTPRRAGEPALSGMRTDSCRPASEACSSVARPPVVQVSDGPPGAAGEVVGSGGAASGGLAGELVEQLDGFGAHGPFWFDAVVGVGEDVAQFTPDPVNHWS